MNSIQKQQIFHISLRKINFPLISNGQSEFEGKIIFLIINKLIFSYASSVCAQRGNKEKEKKGNSEIKKNLSIEMRIDGEKN